MGFINIGFGNIINDTRIVAIVSPDSAPSKRLLQSSRDEGRIIDATQGRRTRAIIVTDTGNVVLSALQPETIASRAGGRGAQSESRAWAGMADEE